METIDTRMIEPQEEEFFDISDKILKLRDKLAEEIVFQNIAEDLENTSNLSDLRLNYIQFFKDRYNEISISDNIYDQDYLTDVVENLSKLVLPYFEEKYKVTLSDSYEYSTPKEYLQMMEDIYEFFFVRQRENLKHFFLYTIKKDQQKFVYKYQPRFNKDPYSKDLFITTQKKKFKNHSDVVMLHFLNDIIDDIIDSLDSMFIFTDTVTSLDLFEETNNRIHEYHMTYGNSITFHEDIDAVKAYIEPLHSADNKLLLRNDILLELLETLEVNPNVDEVDSDEIITSDESDE